ncbi:TRAP transporter small permease [Tamlana agarivorans]|uniref:TRAP transporter small permease n=1 Tax=Pseudotamlana agarivorans TaxID=481183 RepID=A0ACC5U9G4_9FLAO|nr:TRAP transporter small permease [Tamlana agarivorans]MBU2950967.1 TRAP transporter small permease [Tamlana agarivorans]
MIREKLDKILSAFLVIIMGVMVINVLWQVFTRYIIGTPSSFTDELARYLMIWVGLLGAAYVSGKNMHVAIDIITPKLQPKTQKKLRIVVLSLIILFCFFALVIGGSRLVYITYILGQHSPALHLPLAVVYLVIPLTGLLIIYYKIDDIKNLN